MQKRICKECGREFEITDSEEQFYKSKNLSLPTHCKACRDRKKQHTTDEQESMPGKEQAPKQNHAEHQNSRKNSKNNLWSLILLAAILVVFAVTRLPAMLQQDESSQTQTITQSAAGTVQENPSDAALADAANPYQVYNFRTTALLREHFEKHGGDFDYMTKEEYEQGACDVINSPKALTKTESEDGDYVYYIEETNEFVILSRDGYIRTYFKPEDGIDYFNRQ